MPRTKANGPWRNMILAYFGDLMPLADKQRPIEILAPAGSPESLLAAVDQGADAVYLGLKQFNARGNALNFTHQELAYYVPLAHERGTKVYLTLNTLVKMGEMSDVFNALVLAVDCGIDGVILQDLGLSRVVAKTFPHLRRHASTQFAVHNKQGVQFCLDEGFHRVVLARELTLEELKDIRAAFPPENIELEVFCHGAMCYTYSGLCFFSGSVGGRSGNRGECAYTCRKGYRILNKTEFPKAAPPGSYANYLFSMKDMNTLDMLDELCHSGIDSLKIEGRRKGPAYVGASVSAYRLGLSGLNAGQSQRHLDLAFGRAYTRAFYQRGQYGDAPIDITSTSSKGLLLGEVEADGSFCLQQQGLQRYDGLRLVKPDRCESHISFRHYRVDGGDFHQPRKGTRILLDPPPQEGTLVYWVKSGQVEDRYRPEKGKLNRELEAVPCLVNLKLELSDHQIIVTARTRYGQVSQSCPFQPSQSGRHLALKELLYRFGDFPLSPSGWEGPDTAPIFAPVSKLKKLRRDLLTALAQQVAQQRPLWCQKEFAKLQKREGQREEQKFAPEYILRIDRLDILSPTVDLAKKEELGIDFVLRPALSTPEWRQAWETLAQFDGPVRMVLPLVLRKWDLRLLERRIAEVGPQFSDWVISNPGHLPFIRSLVSQPTIHADFSFYHLNQWACQALDDLGIRGRKTISLENDLSDIEALLDSEEPGSFEVIAYTDTPLFIAEACSLAALYGGCPGTKVCGHETLEIENEHGDRFQVKHDRCRSTVIGDKPLCWSGQLEGFRRKGVRTFRIDFTMGRYTAQTINGIFQKIKRDQPISETHKENLNRVLL